jgi:type II secretory ATPase GspE/PulE/Tfp pilus assembly ATPase PilB-like protein
MTWPHMYDFPLADFVRAGGYVSIVKSVLALLVLLVWARMLTWADKDAVDAHLPRIPLNSANLGGLVVAYAAFFFLPTFILPFIFLLLVAGAEVGVYLQMRKKVVGLGDLRKQWDAYVKSWTARKSEAEGPEKVAITGKDGKPIPRPERNTPTRPAYDAIQLALAEPLRKNAEQIDIAPSSQGLSCKYTVDGVAYDGPALDPTAGAAGIWTLKAAAGMDVNERRKPQTGTLKANAAGRKLELKLQSAGSTAGEYMRVLVDSKSRHGLRLEQMGLPPDTLATIKETAKARTGIVLVAAPKGQGMTSMLYAILRAHDAFIEHIHSIERDPDQELEGITQNKLAGNVSAADEAKQVDWVASQEPDVIAMNKVESPQSAAFLVDYAASGKMAYVAVRAGSAADALNQWRKLAGERAFESVKLVVCSRVVRKLCMACKEGYTPDPNTLRKLGLDPARVSTLYKAREVALRDPKTNQPIPCDFCKDLRFQGRTGVFELLRMDEDMKTALAQDYAKGPTAGSAFKAAFRKQRGRYLQEEALSLVERGDTSVQEVLRVLRGGESKAPAAPAPDAGAQPAVRPAGGAARAAARPPAR